jgi:2-hydroxy-3-oxopropionate reductase
MSEVVKKSPPQTVVAVLGIGLMGMPMARRLCEAGYRVQVWNRSPAKARALVPHGATAFDHPADAVRQADVVITMLQDGAAVHEVLFQRGTVDGLRPGTLVVDMSSIQPREARDHASRLAALQVNCLDAPVSGGTVGAEAGTLAIMAGGRVADFERARPVLQVLGRPTHVGPLGAGQLAKLANQMIVGITIGAVAEALLLCQKGGAIPAKVKEAITGGFADSRILQVHGQRMVERDFEPRGRMTVQLKDMRNALDTASGLGFDAPITGLLEKLYADGVEHGLSDLDQAGLFVELARRNGMA